MPEQLSTYKIRGTSLHDDVQMNYIITIIIIYNHLMAWW